MVAVVAFRRVHVCCVLAVFIVLCPIQLSAHDTDTLPDGQRKTVRIGHLANGGLTLDVRLSIVKSSLERTLGEDVVLDGLTLFKTGGVSYLKASGSRGPLRLMVAIALEDNGTDLTLASDAVTHLCESSCPSCEYVLDIELHITGCSCGSAKKSASGCVHTLRPDVAATLTGLLKASSAG